MPLLLLTFFACRAPYVPPDEPGPYAAGATTLTVTDPRGKTLTVEVWYPAVPGEGEIGPYEPTVLSFEAVRDAPPAETKEPWPLVAFSHGNVAIRFQSAFLTEHLATHGFVVVAPDHEHNTLFDIDPDAFPNVILERPDDIRYAIDGAIDEAAGDGLLAGLLEEGSYAMTGHSLGGLTSLIVGGGRVDLQEALDFCGEGGDSPACDVLADDMLAEIPNHGTADDRVVTTVSMSPLGWYAFEGRGPGLESVRKPFIIGGERDEVTEYDLEIEPIYDNLSSPRALLGFENAGHYSFSDICEFAAPFFDECDPDGGFAPLAEVQGQTRRAVTAWLKVELEGDDRYADVLEPAAWDDDVGVTLLRD